MLKATILNGERQGFDLVIPIQGAASTPSAQWILENEAVTFELTLDAGSSDVLLNLYDHSIEPSDTVYLADDKVRYVWKPKSRGRWSYECLFFNYFGIAELNVVFKDTSGEISSIEFEPVEILASKAKAENVESMIMYLSSLGEDKLQSLFQTTKFGAGFRDGIGSPISYLERLEASVETLSFHIQQIIRKPLSKLSPKASIVQPLGDEQLDDRSVSWLMGNLSVLEAVDNTHEAHLSHGEHFYRASSIEVTRVKEDTNIYENEVIYAAVLFLKQKTSEQMEAYAGISNNVKNGRDFPSGYVSFFSQVSKLKTQLLGNQFNRCRSILDKLSYLQLLLERNLPVTRVTIARPKLTSKAASNVSYRAVFGEFILWLECNKPDWSLYRSLLAITSIPTLFELYTYYRLEETLQELIYRDDSATWNVGGSSVSLHYEPIYWMKGNSNENDSNIINVEGKRVTKDGEVVKRKETHKYSHRSPDYVIEISSQESGKKLLVLDAKYTFASKAFSHYLPECTMKYVHGIALREGGRLPVDSMTILYPNENIGLESFHTEEYGIYGYNPVFPSLQTLGVALGDMRLNDSMTSTVKRLLELSGVPLSIGR